MSLSPEDQIELEKLTSQVRRMLAVYWTSLIPIIMSQYLLDRFLTIIFGSNFSPFEGVPPYFPLWVVVSFLNLALMFAWTWLWWIRSSVTVKTAIGIVWVTFLCFMGYITEANTPANLGLTFWSFFPILWALIFVLLPGTFILSMKAKTAITKATLILGYIVAFGIVHWIFYLPMVPEFTWAGTETTWVGNILITTVSPIMAGVAVLFMIFMAILGSPRVRTKIIMHELEEHRSKRKNE